MPDLAKLKDALRRTAADGLGPARAEPFARPEEGVALILAAVAGTYLGRRLTLSFDDGAELALEAAGRRLRRILEPLPPGLEGPTGGELRAAEAPDAAALLLAACTGRGALSIEARPIAADPAEGGVSVAALSDALGLDPAPAPDLARDLGMEGFLEAMGADLLAALWIEGEEVEVAAGDEARAAALPAFAGPMLERLLAPEFPLAAGFETDGIFVFLLPPGAGRHLIVAGRLGAYLVAEARGEDPGATLRAWTSARG